MNASSHPIRDIAAPGVKAEPQLARNLRQEVATLLGRNQITFPGAQPVSFSRRHIEELMREEYVFRFLFHFLPPSTSWLS